VSPGLTWENLLTTACWFISSLHGSRFREIAAAQRPNFRQRRIVAVTARILLCEILASPIALRRSVPPCADLAAEAFGLRR
ncbi:hypothetical protein KCQ62_26635, partial [Klebsiella pneumoniae]|uniref:hypothetical protein n=1 Tax=Klebsiella pneumoniae TaxID=573 RepID=UPI001BA51020